MARKEVGKGVTMLNEAGQAGKPSKAEVCVV